MPDDTEQWKRFTEIDRELRDLETRQAVLKEKKKTAESQLAELKVSMEKAGTTPESIDSDLAFLKQKLSQLLVKYEDEVRQYRDVIQSAESSLA